ncbi:Hca operon transcriptional activator [Slackia heliotrinireducens]|uniref:Transcriptional regulator n=1 Tax=Slackia heliotrinireducens (strain ATCC 29202 / DSM 20476 / NCTC 11029 / RHS 1) TaxID=471855 RepID=C7N2J3_SLAHD|nr:LysR family transcriptional regulator [Slackia heliotrinireducens]ACV23501.1 transcriptional regulator [Slackia heliotrinireducens DSM 20476]VEH02868.1 Hca operon transcriptional activator [Slackia heliotrinireducens]
MDTAKMREFVHLSEGLNFTRTAREFYVSQSTLSKHIRQVEEELGCPLISRTTHDVCLTPEGSVVHDAFRSLLEGYDSLLSQLDDMRKGIAGKLRVGFIYYGGMHYMRFGLDAFYQTHPNVQIDFLSQQPHQTIDMLKRGELDFGLLYRAKSLPESEYEFIHVHDCALHAYLSTSSDLAHKEFVTADDLQGRSFVFLSKDEEYNENIRALLALADVTPGEAAWCRQVDEFARALQSPDRVFLSTRHMPSFDDDGLCSVPIADDCFKLEVGFYVRRDNESLLASGFAEVWRNLASG